MMNTEKMFLDVLLRISNNLEKIATQLEILNKGKKIELANTIKESRIRINNERKMLNESRTKKNNKNIDVFLTENKKNNNETRY